MKGYICILALGLVAVLTGGCESRLNVPTLASGSAAVYESGNLVQTHTLSEAEIAQVSSWLRDNDAGWDSFIATPAGNVTAKLIAMDGTPVGLYMLDGLVVVNFSDSQFSKSFSEDELRRLELALGVAN